MELPVKWKIWIDEKNREVLLKYWKTLDVSSTYKSEDSFHDWLLSESEDGSYMHWGGKSLPDYYGVTINIEDFKRLVLKENTELNWLIYV